MARHDDLSSLFTDIANSIRYMKSESSSVTYKADDFDLSIRTIPSGEKPQETFDVTPSLSVQTITPQTGYVFSGGTVRAMPTGTQGTPIATKGTVSNNSITVTPSATDTTGYITGATLTGNAVTVTAAELVSGNKVCSSSDAAQTGIDVTNYATVSISAMPAGSATTPATTKQQSAPTFTRNGNDVTANVAATSVSVTPTIVSGYINTGTAGTITMSANSATYTIPTQTKTITANGTFTPTSGYLFSQVTVSIPSYTGLG